MRRTDLWLLVSPNLRMAAKCKSGYKNNHIIIFRTYDVFTNFELGPLGKENLMRIEKYWVILKIKKLRLQIEKLLPDHQYQIIVGKDFVP